jgi:hypothetical protein
MWQKLQWRNRQISSREAVQSHSVSVAFPVIVRSYIIQSYSVCSIPCDCEELYCTVSQCVCSIPCDCEELYCTVSQYVCSIPCDCEELYWRNKQTSSQYHMIDSSAFRIPVDGQAPKRTNPEC